jgi:hypothetical protein
MATCGLGGPMNPKSKTCFRYFPTTPTKQIIYIYNKNKRLPNAEILSSLVLLSKSVWHTVAKRVLAKVLAKALQVVFPLGTSTKPDRKNSVFHMVLIVFVAIPNGTASYRRLTLVFVLCY